MLERPAALLIWDDPAEPPAFDGIVLLWQSYRRTQDPNVVSLPERVDAHAEDLRRRYLAFVRQVGETLVGGETVIDHLELRPGLSYWWMTLIAQKDVYASSPHIYDVIKLFAFEDFVRAYEGAALRVCSRKAEVPRVLRAWCRGEGRRFEFTAAGLARGAQSWRTLYRTLPARVRALVTFIKLITLRVGVAGPQLTKDPPSGNDVAIFAPFTHLSQESLSTRVFGSVYWSRLVPWLNESGLGVNWFHLFYQHPAVPNVPSAVSLAAAFTGSSPRQFHQIVDGRISWRLVAAIARDFLRVGRAGKTMAEVHRIFRPRGSNLDLWEMFRSDWRESIGGSKAVVSLFHLNVLEQRIGSLPHQKLGLYIQENQPWELALVRLWKTYGHGLLVGAAHTTVPFWDLRYFFDPAALRADKNGLPMPDLVALNGPNAVSRFEAAGYPADRYREVEALRYLYLADFQRASRAEAAKTPRTLRLLVLGDLLPEYTDTQLSYLEGCGDIPGTELEIVFKPHPAAADTQRRIEGRDFRLSTRHISDELGGCDAVFVGSATSAASDAFQIGVPVISVNDAGRINFSPLYRTPGVHFVSSPDQLAAALSHIVVDSGAPRGSFFTLDDAIPRWKSLVQEALRCA